jgi:predicted phosphodiesterase
VKLLASGDWHLTNRSPRKRVDDCKETLVEKILEIKKIGERFGAEYILQPGDLCDSDVFPDSFKTKWIPILRPMRIISIPGQHDMRYHTSDISNTSLGVLSEGAMIQIAGPKPLKLLDNVHVYGAGWNAPIPKIKDASAFNILLVHKMIIVEKIWTQQEDYVLAKDFLEKNKFDLIVSGDNHSSFFLTAEGRSIINCGNLLRNRIDQADHIPHVYLIDTDKKEIKKEVVPHADFSDIMKIDEAKNEETINKNLELMKASLKNKKKIKGLDYPKRVAVRIKELKKNGELKPMTEEIIGEIMG